MTVTHVEVTITSSAPSIAIEGNHISLTFYDECKAGWFKVKLIISEAEKLIEWLPGVVALAKQEREKEAEEAKAYQAEQDEKKAAATAAAQDEKKAAATAAAQKAEGQKTDE